MPTREATSVVEEELPETREVPEVEIRGDEAVIHVQNPEQGVEERRVKLPKTTWG